MAVAAVDYFVGSLAAEHPPARVAARAHRDRRRRAAAGHGALPALHHRAVRGCSPWCCSSILSKTRFGSRLRAAVDDPRVAAGLGINVNVVFLLTFAVGSGLAGLGGALGAEILGMDPTFPLKYMIYFLIVVSVGGTSSITGPLLAALLLGIADVAGKYFIPKMGAFTVYLLMIADPDVAAAGPVHAQGRRKADGRRSPRCCAQARWRPWEFARLGAWPSRCRLLLPVACADGQRDRDRRAVRDVARPDPGLHRHRVAGPCGLLRLRRLHARRCSPST